MNGHTYGTTPIVEILNALPVEYAMNLRRADMAYLLTALLLVSQAGMGGVDEELAEWAGTQRQLILGTIGIEEG